MYSYFLLTKRGGGGGGGRVKQVHVHPETIGSSRAGSTTFGALGKNFKWDIFYI